MSYPSINEVTADRGVVLVKTRQWDGIDRPEYVHLEPLSPEQARYWADVLETHANLAEGQRREMQDDQLKKKREKLEQLRVEIGELEREISGA